MAAEDNAQPDKGSLTDLEYALLREYYAAEYLRSGGPDTNGAVCGINEWIMEQAFLHKEQKVSE